MKNLFRLVLGAAAIGLMTACSAGTSAADAPPAKGVSLVVARDMAFAPRVIEVPVGTTVTWRFEDGSVPHDVKGDGFASPVARSGTFTHRFGAPGAYDYVCTLHPRMTGRVIVTG